jgi:hypothetical protein
MGRYGRYRGGGRDTTEGYRQLDVRWMQRKGFLRAGSWSSLYWSRNGERFASIQVRADFNNSVTLMYRHRSYGDEEWTKAEYPVSLEWTRCNFGGERAWFLCPRPGCGRRVAKLWGGVMFYCRQCYNLAYESQNETAHDRELRKHQAIRMKLGGSGSLAEDFPHKPKGMHWQTYWRLCRKAEEAESRSWPPWVLKMIANS